MDSAPTLLDAVARKGVLISVHIRFWRACRRLNPEDLGLRPDQIDPRLFSLGHKRLLPRDCLERLALIEGRAHALVEESSFPFLNGLARYVPNARLQDVTARLQALEQDFQAAREDFIRRYGPLREAALSEWRKASRALLGDRESLVSMVSTQFPRPEDLPRYFAFETRLFTIQAPELSTARLIEAADQQEIIAVRRKAAEQARRDIEQSCRTFIADCAAELRSQTAKLCDEMLETMRTGGGVHQRTLNRLVAFIDRFRDLNFVNDTEMERRLQEVRDQFLGTPAAEYRDSTVARHRLTQGLEALRNEARTLAAQDTTALVEAFGQLGRRRFNLAA